MTHNQETHGLGRVTDLPITVGTFAQLYHQQLTNQVQVLTQAVLAIQGKNQTLSPPTSLNTLSNIQRPRVTATNRTRCP